jgi:hypothetical protein
LVVFGPRVWTAANEDLVGIELGSGEITSRTHVGGEIASLVGDGPEVLAVTVDGRVGRAER